MPIWIHKPTVEQLNRFRRNTLMEHLDIQYTEIGDDYLKASMPVDHRTHQPMGILHGGASVALAESLGSVAATLCVDVTRKYCVGIEINANHLRQVRTGKVVGTARPLHLGNKIHVWEIRITDEQEQLVCTSRITLMVMDRKANTTGSG